MCRLLKWSIHDKNAVLRWMEIFSGRTAGWFKLPVQLHSLLCELLYFASQTIKISHYSLSVYQPRSSGRHGGHGTLAYAAATAAGRGIADGHGCFLPGSSYILLQKDRYNCDRHDLLFLCKMFKQQKRKAWSQSFDVKGLFKAPE